MSALLKLIPGDLVRIKRTRTRGTVISAQDENRMIRCSFPKGEQLVPRDQLLHEGMAPGGGIGTRVYEDGKTVREVAGLS